MKHIMKPLLVHLLRWVADPAQDLEIKALVAVMAYFEGTASPHDTQVALDDIRKGCAGQPTAHTRFLMICQFILQGSLTPTTLKDVLHDIELIGIERSCF